jgi:hypothetical protein
MHLKKKSHSINQEQTELVPRKHDENRPIETRINVPNTFNRQTDTKCNENLLSSFEDDACEWTDMLKKTSSVLSVLLMKSITDFMTGTECMLIAVCQRPTCVDLKST